MNEYLFKAITNIAVALAVITGLIITKHPACLLGLCIIAFSYSGSNPIANDEEEPDDL
jgi:hypothetical protein